MLFFLMHVLPNMYENGAINERDFEDNIQYTVLLYGISCLYLYGVQQAGSFIFCLNTGIAPKYMWILM